MAFWVNIIMAIEDLFISSAKVERPAATQDSLGSWTESWSTVYSGLPCRVQPVSGVEALTDDKETVIITHKVFCKAASGILGKDRLTISGLTLRVHSVRNIDLMGHHDEILCTEKRA